MYLKHLIISVLAILTVFSSLAAVQDNPVLQQIDSIRLALPSLEENSKLDAYSKLIRLTQTYGDSDSRLKLFDEFMAYADSVGAVKKGAYARIKKAEHLLNHSMTEPFYESLPEALQFMEQNENWSYYFLLFQMSISIPLHQHKAEEATEIAFEAYNKAKEVDFPEGIGIMAAAIAEIYYFIGRFTEGEMFAREAVAIFKKETSDPSNILNAYDYLCASLMGQKRYEEALPIFREWEEKVVELENARGRSDYIRLYLETKYANLYLYMDSLEQAGIYIKRVEDYIHKVPAKGQVAFLSSQIQYYEATGNYEKALEATKKHLALIPETNQNLPPAMLFKKAMLEEKCGLHQEALASYRVYMRQMDSLNLVKVADQLSEMQIVYEVDKITAEKKQQRLYLIFALTGCLLLGLLLFIWIRYSRKLKQNMGLLKKKNHALYNQLQEQDVMQKEIERLRNIIGDAPFDKEGQNTSDSLYQQALAYLNRTRDFLDPTLTRESLALKLGTNRQYLCDAIQKATGLTFKDFMDKLRLNHAKNMLLNDTTVPIESILNASGFSNKSTFYRLFRERYGLTPTELRNEKTRLLPEE